MEDIADRGILRGRAHCAAALARTLDRLIGCPGVTEIQLQREWMLDVARSGQLTEGGWYSPPPLGSTVLSGSTREPRRLTFKSLRDAASFPDEREVTWREGLLFVYCSNIYLPEGMPSDFSTTLYFGEDQAFIDYVMRASQCARRIADLSLGMTGSRDLFDAAQRLLAENGFANTVHSVTDVTPLDYGHSLMRISQGNLARGGNLEPGVCAEVSSARKFINGASDWRLDQVEAYTVEPQIVDLAKRDLPKLTFHYLISQHDGGVIEDSIEAFLPSGRWGTAFRKRAS